MVVGVVFDDDERGGEEVVVVRRDEGGVENVTNEPRSEAKADLYEARHE